MKLRVSLKERSYDIQISDSFDGLPNALSRLDLPRQVWVVSHRSVLSQHGPSLLVPLRKAGWEARTVEVPESETSKSLSMVQRVAGEISEASAMYVPLLVAFGGGVIGDLTGFVAATLRRGVPYVQVPTTLLAQVDSAIGGKVGVDLPHGKNLVGAFYQPRLVWNNTSVLRTLPMRQRRSGLGEIIKCGVIADPELFVLLERSMEDCLSLETRAVRGMVERSCAIKARVVSRDEHETKGLRLILNFGHTAGHALETATGYRQWTHGEAVAVGMGVATSIAVEMDLCSTATARRIEAVTAAAGLPVRAGGVNWRDVLKALRYDKKFVQGKARWVLPTRVGRVVISDRVSETLVRQVLPEYFLPR